MTLRTIGTAVVTAALSASALAACSSSGGSHPSGGASTPASSGASTSASPMLSSPAPTTDPGAGLSVAKATAALLTQTEVANGLTKAPNQASDTPFPCTPKLPPPDEQVPPRFKVAATYADDTKGLQFVEEITNYGDAVSAEKALVAGEKGLSCSDGEVGAVPVTIQGPIDLAKSFPSTELDKVEAWTLGARGAKQSIIVAKIGAQLVALTFAEGAGADDTSEDAAGITSRALAKVVKAAA